jgi:hypothetical protein
MQITIPEMRLGILILSRIDGAGISFFSPPARRKWVQSPLGGLTKSSGPTARFQGESNQSAKALPAEGFGSSWEMWDTSGAQNHPSVEEVSWPELPRSIIRATWSRPCCF